MHIFWFANAPWAHTGYGVQTNLFWWRIQKLGHKVTLGANYGLAGSPLNIQEQGEESRVFPCGYTAHGNDILAPHAKYVKADIVITLYDTWVFTPNVTSQFRWCPYLPIDHDPAPPAVIRAIEPAWQPIAYSQFGAEKLKEAGFDARYVPHAVDTKVYMPGDRDVARKALKLPQDDFEFMAVMVAANKGAPSRKAFPEVLWAWREFIEDHPKSLLFIHTHAGQEMQGLDLIELLKELHMPERAVLFCDPYWNIIGYPPSYMANLYNAADVLLNPSYGEGFGLPVLEAQSCGTPVIVNDCTSMPELCFAGWKTGNQPFYTPQGSWQFVPKISDIVDALGEAYEKRNYDKLRRDARKGAEQYDADLVTEKYWKPVLAEMAEEIESAELQLVEA